MPFDLERAAALPAVIQAMELVRRIQSELVPADAVAKADSSPVTVADFASQAVICRALAASFPQDPVVAEETSDPLRRDPALQNRVAAYVQAPANAVCDWIDRGRGEPGARFWTLDPIDGTKGFLRRGQYAVALALVVDGRVALGVLGCPNLPPTWREAGRPPGCLLLAVRGAGTRMTDAATGDSRTVQVSETNHRHAESFAAEHGDAGGQAEVARRLGLPDPPIRIDSQAKYALVARGDAGLLLRLPRPDVPDYRECIWDHAAGSVVVEEAGGIVSDCAGRPLDFARGRRLHANRGIVVASPALHRRAIAAIAGRG